MKGVIGLGTFWNLTLKRRWFIFPPRKTFEVTIVRPEQETKTWTIPICVDQIGYMTIGTKTRV